MSGSDSAASTRAPTHLTFQHDSHMLQLDTCIVSVSPASELDEENKKVFKQEFAADDHVIVTKATVFHPQGGGQPTDQGTMVSIAATESARGIISFDVTSVRMEASNGGQVLHLGRYTNASPCHFQPGDSVIQAVDAEKRLLYSRLHTAGHILGSAVRHLLENEVENFDELKASHFPDNAGCEFQGLIDGKWKAAIQKRVNEYIQRAVRVEIDFWTEEDFQAQGLARLIPARSLLPPGEEKFRVVKLVGLETYPCGGTHVDTSDLCGETVVKKISRSKGNSRVSYTVQIK